MALNGKEKTWMSRKPFRKCFEKKIVCPSVCLTFFESADAHDLGLMTLLIQQVTRGHNIVADGWEGRPTPIHTQSLSQNSAYTKSFQNACFPTFRLMLTDHWTDQQIDGQTDKASYRVACPQLKMGSVESFYNLLYSYRVGKSCKG